MNITTATNNDVSDIYAFTYVIIAVLLKMVLPVIWNFLKQRIYQINAEIGTLPHPQQFVTIVSDPALKIIVSLSFEHHQLLSDCGVGFDNRGCRSSREYWKHEWHLDLVMKFLKHDARYNAVFAAIFNSSAYVKDAFPLTGGNQTRDSRLQI